MNIDNFFLKFYSKLEKDAVLVGLDFNLNNENNNKYIININILYSDI